MELSKSKLAVITGADGGMGTEITRAVANAGYQIIMLCYNSAKGNSVCQRLIQETGNPNLEVMQIDLASLESVASLANRLLERNQSIDLLMNNAGTMATCFQQTQNHLERTVSVNYVAPYLLTRKLIPLMHKGSRIVNMVSCTYAIGKLDFPAFFTQGKKGSFLRIPIYSNTKLALLLFTFELAEQLKDTGICVNAADPGIVSTSMITMHQWFDPLTDLFFRPFIRKPAQGASTAIGLLLDVKNEGVTGTFNLNNHPKKLSEKYILHPQRKQLWNETEKKVEKWLNH